jgi:uncharacterized membrane protein
MTLTSVSPDQRAARPGVLARTPAWQVVSVVLIVAALADSAYLTWVHYQPQALVCGIDGGCHTVQNSDYAVVGNVPVATLGLALYIVLLGLAVVRILRPALAPVISVAMVGSLIGAVVYYGYLTWVEVAVLDAICQWCVLGALLTVALLIVEGVGLGYLLARLGD